MSKTSDINAYFSRQYSRAPVAAEIRKMARLPASEISQMLQQADGAREYMRITGTQAPDAASERAMYARGRMLSGCGTAADRALLEALGEDET